MVVLQDWTGVHVKLHPETHLKGTKAELDVESRCLSGVLRQESKYSVVHAKQRDQEQRGLGQPPAKTATWTSFRPIPAQRITDPVCHWTFETVQAFSEDRPT